MIWFLVGVYIMAAIASVWLIVIIDKSKYPTITEKMLEDDIVAGFLWPITWPLALFLWLYDKFSEWILRKINGGD